MSKWTDKLPESARDWIAGRRVDEVECIIADIAGDKEAAARVELVLPETGVCSRSPVTDAEGCCGGPAKSDVSACCVSDEKAKADGKAGCGCGLAEPQKAKASSCCG